MKNKKYFFIACFILLFFLSKLYAFEKKLQGIYLKIAVDEHHYLTIDYSQESNEKKFIEKIATKVVKNYLDLNTISTEFYTKKVEYLNLKNKKIKISKFQPLFNDRFTHVIWTLNNNIIYKHEVYDLSNKLMYLYTIKNLKTNQKYIPKIHGGYYIYKGFKLIYSGKTEDGENQMLLSDGLNSFSIFWKKSNKKIKVFKRILMGNYILREHYNGYIFTVVGTIPFFEMEKIIKYFIQKEVIR